MSLCYPKYQLRGSLHSVNLCWISYHLKIGEIYTWRVELVLAEVVKPQPPNTHIDVPILYSPRWCYVFVIIVKIQSCTCLFECKNGSPLMCIYKFISVTPGSKADMDSFRDNLCSAPSQRFTIIFCHVFAVA